MNIETNLLAKLKAWQSPQIAIVSLTHDGRAIAKRIKTELFCNAKNYVRTKDDCALEDCEEELLASSAIQTIQASFRKVDAIICIMATGIVVRAIAPLIVDKTSDPAVIVIDDQGKNVISLLSGHIGNANQWTKRLADLLVANPVITTATDARNTVGLDELAMHVQAVYDDFKQNTRRFNMMIANRQSIALINETDVVLDGVIQQTYVVTTKEQFFATFDQNKETGLIMISNHPDPLTEQEKIALLAHNIAWVQLIPRQYVLGIGCRKDTLDEILATNVSQFLNDVLLHPFSICKIVSIDVKKNEKAIIHLAQKMAVDFETFPQATLVQYEDLYPGSEFVKKTVGVASVSQTAAHHETNGNVLSGRYANQGVTITLAKYK